MLTVLDRMMTPCNARGVPLPPVVLDGAIWSPVVLTDSCRCRACRRQLRAGQPAYESPKVMTGWRCVGCAAGR